MVFLILWRQISGDIINKIDKIFRLFYSGKLNEYQVDDYIIISSDPSEVRIIDNLVIIGDIYSSKVPDVSKLDEYIREFMKKSKPTVDDLKKIDDCIDGRYLVLNTEKNEIFIDPIGLQTAYIGNGVIASDLKLIWVFNIKAFLIPPNRIYRFNRSISCLTPVRYLINDRVMKKKTNVDFNHATEVLKEYLIVRTRILASHVKDNVNEVYVAFSGGIDSSLTAVLSAKTDLPVNLITVALRNSYDVDASVRSANLLNMSDRHNLVYLDEFNRDLLREIILTIESSDIMQVSLSIPLYMMMLYLKQRREKSVIFMGQGSDELYCGYVKYLHICREKSLVDAFKECIRDFIFSYRVNFQRETKISRRFNIDIYYPLISPSIYLYITSLPPTYLIANERDGLRKRIIRGVASKLNIPEDIIYRRKKSMQYSSGSEKILMKLIAKDKIKLLNELSNILNELIEEVRSI